MPPNAKSLSVVIVNYNGGKYLAPCLETLREQDFKDYELVVVDNASPDGSWAIVEKIFPEALVERNADNLGFARGMNQGVALTRAPYILALNFDTLLDRAFLGNLLHALDARAQCGSACGKIFRMNADFGRTDILDSAGHTLLGRTPGRRGWNERDAGLYEREDIVFGAPGALALFRRKMLDHVAFMGEYFDESFFMYLEDVDLDWRANLFGWQCLYTPGAAAYHVTKGSFETLDEKRSGHFARLCMVNEQIMKLKNDTPAMAAKTMAAMLLRTARMYRVKAGRWDTEFLRYWQFLLLTLRKRRFIAAEKKLGYEEMDYWFRNVSKPLDA